MGIVAPEVRYQLQIPPGQEGGVYANTLAVWHTGHEFTLDFAVTLPSREDDAGGTIVPCSVVARVKIPPTLAFDIIKTLNENMTRYEEKYGEIKRPELRQPPESPASGEPPGGQPNG